jgi:hypothetical protein
MGRRVIAGVSFAAAAAAAAAFAFACGQSATSIDACDTIEHARCLWIEQCFADAAYYGLPTPRSNSSSPVDDCDRFYKDACLHGLVTTITPSTAEVTACVTAINAATDCTIVANPETSDACAFLLYDAGADSD